MKTKSFHSDSVFEFSCVYNVSADDDIRAELSILAEPRAQWERLQSRRSVYLAASDSSGRFLERLSPIERDFVIQVLVAPSAEILVRLARLSVGIIARLRTRTPVAAWVWGLFDPEREQPLTNTGGVLWQDHPSKESYRWDRSGGTLLPATSQEPDLPVFLLAQDGLAIISPSTLEDLFGGARDQFAGANRAPIHLFGGVPNV